MKTFTRYQRKILISCFLVYLFTYVGRLNLSATLSDIISELSIDSARGGLIQSLFAVSYAAGQLLFGFMADKMEPKRLMICGLLGSALSNLLFSVMRSYGLLLAMWTVNGIFQSMIWTPIVLVMTRTFEEKQRKSASLVMSFTLAAGHFAAWALAMWLAQRFTWRLSYRIPALVLAVASVIAIVNLPGKLRSVDESRHGEAKASAPIKALFGTGLVMLLLCCAANGFVRDGVITWAPTILTGDADGSSMLFSLVIPCINLFGIVLGAYLVRHVKGSIRRLIGLMMGGVALPAVVLFAVKASPVYLMAILLGMMSAILYGTNPLLTTLVPMQYDSFGRVGLVAGLIDCFIYLGSSLAGTFTGLMHDLSGGTWGNAYVLWAIVSILGCALGILASRHKISNSED